jgi:hypothetical protein
MSPDQARIVAIHLKEMLAKMELIIPEVRQFSDVTERKLIFDTLIQIHGLIYDDLFPLIVSSNPALKPSLLPRDAPPQPL